MKTTDTTPADTAEHTPGPWRVNTDEPLQVISMPLATDDVESDVAICDCHDFDSVHQGCGAANARLIAAAPDLLAALEAVEAKLTDAGRAFYVDGKRSALVAALCGWKSVAEQARRAIAAAKGGAA